VAELLRSSPGLRVTLRGYTAPYSTPGARRRLSELRARFCETYLRDRYGIAGNRITVEWYGSDKLPEAADGTDWRRRCVELIIENNAGEPLELIPVEAPDRVVRTLYFPADAEVPVTAHLVEVDAVAELLRSSPDLRVTLRGYTAPYSTPGARRRLSELRARFCETYLRDRYGIAGNRITVEWYGSDKLPEAADGTDWRRRCVELIIENNTGRR
jgi:outer membrane protein OmpA-like peptidoglycan-associated protein